MKERKLSGNSSCFLIRDERLKTDFHRTPIYDFLKSEGFEAVARSYFIEGIDWLFVNISSKVYAKGRGGIALAPVAGNHAVTFEEFLLIYGIFKKYNDFTPKMNAQRGEVCDHV